MKKWVVGILGCVLVVVAGSPVYGQETATLEDTEQYIQVIQRKPFVKALRLEIEPTFNLPLNDDFTRHVGAGVQVRFHISDEWAIGADYIKYWGWATDLGREVREGYNVQPRDRFAQKDFYVGGHVAYVPVQGKLLWFGSLGPVVYWDAYLIAGGGAAKTRFRDYHGSGNIGLGVRLSLAQWITLNFEIRDYMYMENFPEGNKFQNNVVFTTGLAFFVPFKHKYVHPK
jgi:outer membrane beta-barrel protein